MREFITPPATKEFQNDLTGLWDSIVLMWESDLTIQLERELNSRLRRRLLPQKSLANLSKEIDGYYQDAIKKIFLQALISSQKSPSEYPKSVTLIRTLRGELGEDLFDSNGLLRAQVLFDVASDIELAGLAVVGLQLIGVSIGSEFVLPGNPVGVLGIIAGGIFLVAESTVELVRIKDADIERTRIMNGLHKHIANSHLGNIYTHYTTQIGGSTIEDVGPNMKRGTESSVADLYREQIVESLPKLKEAIFGTVKD